MCGNLQTTWKHALRNNFRFLSLHWIVQRFVHEPSDYQNTCPRIASSIWMLFKMSRRAFQIVWITRLVPEIPFFADEMQNEIFAYAARDFQELYTRRYSLKEITLKKSFDRRGNEKSKHGACCFNFASEWTTFIRQSDFSTASCLTVGITMSRWMWSEGYRQKNEKGKIILMSRDPL